MKAAQMVVAEFEVLSFPQTQIQPLPAQMREARRTSVDDDAFAFIVLDEGGAAYASNGGSGVQPISLARKGQFGVAIADNSAAIASPSSRVLAFPPISGVLGPDRASTLAIASSTN